MPRVAPLALAAWVAAVPAAARGDGPALEPEPLGWAAVARPGAVRAAAARARAEALLEEADELEGGRAPVGDELRRALVRRALGWAGRALALDPTEPDAHALLFQARLEAGDDLGALAALAGLRRLGRPHALDGSLAFGAGVALSRLGRFDEAVVEYDRGRRLRDDPSDGATELANSAEAAMALGPARLPDALARYEQALALTSPPGPDAPCDLALHRMGLAVALDRDEQVERSRRVLAQALADQELARALLNDPTASCLRQPGVFFVPDGDVRYYEALADELRGDLAEARRGWRRFLDEAPRSPYAPRARARLQEARPARPGRAAP